MVREDILGGLKSALLRGYTLKDAMISFYNAGYVKEDIEEAARKLQYQLIENKELRDLANSSAHGMSPNAPPSPGSPGAKATLHSIKKVEKSGKPIPGSMAPIVGGAPPMEKKNKSKSFSIEFKHKHKEKPQKKNQKKPVSNYGQNIGVRVATITLVVVLLVLVGALIGIVLFKEPIIQFFNNVLK